MKIERGGGRSLELARGDIVREQTDAIVNAANSSLLGGGGVDGAIHRAGGPSILAECQAWVAAHGRLQAGGAMATGGGRLPARHLIHTVGPVYRDGAHGEPETLASCYRASLALADQLTAASVSFPSISTGAFRYPVEQAAPIALAAVAETLVLSKHVRHIRFVLFDQETLDAYREVAERL